jgi:D-lyxose isomerase
MAEDGQRAPHHFHVVKTEDIANRGGARFVVELFKVDAQGAPVKDRFRALKDVSVLDLKYSGPRPARRSPPKCRSPMTTRPTIISCRRSSRSRRSRRTRRRVTVRDHARA